MTRPAMTLDELEARRQTAVKNLSAGRRGYAMKAIVAYDVLTQDMPALLEMVRVAETLATALEGYRSSHPALAMYRTALDNLHAAKALVP